MLDRTCLLDGHVPVPACLPLWSVLEPPKVLRKTEAAGETRERVGSRGAGYTWWWLLCVAPVLLESSQTRMEKWPPGWVWLSQKLARQAASAGTCTHGSPSRWHKRPRLVGLSQLQAPVSIPKPLATASSFIALWVVPSRGVCVCVCEGVGALTDNRASCAAPHPSPVHSGQVGIWPLTSAPG